MSVAREIIRGLIIGVQRELARETGRSIHDAVTRHGAWLVMTGGFGLTYEQVARAQNVSKQAVSEGVARFCDRMEERTLERAVQRVADVFEVSL